MYRPHSPSNAFLNINSQIIKKKKKKEKIKVAPHCMIFDILW